MQTTKTNNKTVNRSDIVVNGIVSLGNFQGTMTDLQRKLSRQVSKTEAKVLPGSPSALRVVINGVVSRLRARGVSVRFTRTTDHSRTRIVKFVQ